MPTGPSAKISGSAAAREPRLIGNNGRLKDQSERLMSLVNRLGNFRDRICGAVPTATSDQPDSTGESNMDVMEAIITDITTSIVTFEETMSQLEGVS